MFSVSEQGTGAAMAQNSVKKPDSLTQAGLNLIQQALSIYDRELRLAVCNSRFTEMFGLPKHLTEPGADFAETIRFLTIGGEYGEIDDVDSFVQEKVDQALAFEAHYVERTRANGRSISIEGSPLRQGGWVTVYTDITSIKRQEALLRGDSAQLSDQLLTHAEELARTNRELAATNVALEETKRDLIDSEALSRMTTEMMPAHIAHLDLEECYTYSNRKLPSVLPKSPVEIAGLQARKALGVEAYQAIKPWLDKAYMGQPSVFEFSHVTAARRIRCAFTPDRDMAGNVSGVYILSMDVTEEAQARAALFQSHKRELAAQLTSGVAHDFANLLTIILGLQGRLKNLPDLPDVAQEMITSTRAAALRGGVLLDRLSNISGHRDLHPTATDLPAMLADIQAMATPSLPEEHQLAYDSGKLDRAVLLDSGLLQDTLLNLILNARDAMGKSSGQIKIDLQPIKDIWLEITVSDTGPGFSQQALEHALDPFYTTKRSDEGSGLGLSTVYDFAQSSGGHLKIANHKNGAIVTLRLPLKYAKTAPTPRFVLLVEDSLEIRTNLREMLRNLGHTVLEATSADEAETLAAIPGIDTVLTDINLDGARTGLDLARTLAKTADVTRLYVMTSLPPENTTRRAAESEFSLIGKPFNQSELAHFLEARA
ncbi:MAG: signal transduction histidine kinase/CheY-like chemotaxis protein [Paracoccaceae bacterium]|jgi:signal transduction histidine kinase/CheY-like chemotaxis protein